MAGKWRMWGWRWRVQLQPQLRWRWRWRFLWRRYATSTRHVWSLQTGWHQDYYNSASTTTSLTTLQQNVQMCTRMTQKCDMASEQVCQQVPIRVPTYGKRTVPQPPVWKMQCEDITEVTFICNFY